MKKPNSELSQWQWTVRLKALIITMANFFFFENPAYFDENYGGDIVCTDLNGKSKQKISGGFYDKVKVYDDNQK